MITVAIISEYNPFHTGHKYHIEKIREEFGQDTRIIAIMSGNYTQRGEIAIMDKSARAECAVLEGVNLVLELPFPFSMSSAEFFAKAGVKIACSLSVVDFLSFGSESGDIKYICEISQNMLSEKFEYELSELIRAEPQSGYAALIEKAYNNLYSKKIDKSFFSANNILALEYIKQLKKQNSKILPHTVKRCGADYSDEKITENSHQSATAIRIKIKDGINTALNYIPDKCKNIILREYNSKKLPTDAEKLSSAVISHFRVNASSKKVNSAEEDLYNRLKKNSFQANTISGLTELADTKKYTHARIKRAIWYSFFGVTSSEIKDYPCYTQVLAMDSVGKSILREIKNLSDFKILTKPSALAGLSIKEKRQKKHSDTADSIFQLTKPSFEAGDASITRTPFILK